MRKVRGLLSWAKVPFTELIASQLMAWPQDVSSSCEPGIIEIELNKHSLEIIAPQNVASHCYGSVRYRDVPTIYLFEIGKLFSCPFLPRLFLGVADKMQTHLFWRPND